ncbi:MAG: DUF4105 domain-containing protein [Tannerellaceae bacterium]|jgi:hypothetical protein|nr:DUF4105 domain-containing protein [Tannerellaceae bacterium]
MNGPLIRKLYSLVALLACTLRLAAIPATLSNEARISLLTCSPTDEAVFTVYGHTAIRVADPAAPDGALDLVFNYGIFDFSQGDFIYRFTKGETDYKLGITPFANFLPAYSHSGAGVTEQILNLTADEKDRLWKALLLNARPENATYRYNFFFDNCATRPVQLIEQSVDGHITYHRPPEQKTFRQQINHCMRHQPWLIFGCQIALGKPTDRIPTAREEFFLPLILEKAFDEATITTPDGQERPLVAEHRTLLDAHPQPAPVTRFTPLAATLLCLALTLLITCYEWKKKTRYAAFDSLLFAVAGLSGTIIYYLAFVSEHPSTWPNYLIFALHPFHLAGAIITPVKKTAKAAYYYHFINFAALTLMLMTWPLIPQHLHIALLPLIASLWTRSGRYISSKRKQ